jgi:hypothetical protein
MLICQQLSPLGKMFNSQIKLRRFLLEHKMLFCFIELKRGFMVMNKIINKTLKTFVFSQILLTSTLFYSPNILADNQCRNLFGISDSVAPATKGKLTQVRKFQTVQLLHSETVLLKKMSAELGVHKFTDHLDLIEQLTEKIATGEGDSISKGQRLSELGLKIQTVLENRLNYFYKKFNLSYDKSTPLKPMTNEQMTEQIKNVQPKLSAAKIKEQVRLAQIEFASVKTELLKARYTLAENIAKLESFKLSEYEFVDTHALNAPGYTLVKLSEYPEFAMSLAKKTNPPKPYGTGGVVTLQEYRDVVSNNLWLFTLHGHDLKHIHFAYSHPLAAASLFRTTRSKNHLRYFLTAAVYEGVDTVQYYFESRLARHFDTLGYSLQEAMVFLASATQQQLVEITELIGVSIDHDQNLKSLREWKPRTLKNELMPEDFKKAAYFEKDIINFVAHSIEDLANPKINYYMRPELLRATQTAPAGTQMKPGDHIHYR